MAKGQLVTVSIPFKYHADPKKNYVLDRGEVIALEGLPNDSILVGLKYLVPIRKKLNESINCPDCGRRFENVHYMHIHRAKRGGCFAEGKPISRREIAEKLDVDPTKVERLEKEVLGSVDDVYVTG